MGLLTCIGCFGQPKTLDDDQTGLSKSSRSGKSARAWSTTQLNDGMGCPTELWRIPEEVLPLDDTASKMVVTQDNNNSHMSLPFPPSPLRSAAASATTSSGSNSASPEATFESAASQSPPAVTAAEPAAEPFACSPAAAAAAGGDEGAAGGRGSAATSATLSEVLTEDADGAEQFVPELKAYGRVGPVYSSGALTGVFSQVPAIPMSPTPGGSTVLIPMTEALMRPDGHTQAHHAVLYAQYAAQRMTQPGFSQAISDESGYTGGMSMDVHRANDDHSSALPAFRAYVPPPSISDTSRSGPLTRAILAQSIATHTPPRTPEQSARLRWPPQSSDATGATVSYVPPDHACDSMSNDGQQVRGHTGAALAGTEAISPYEELPGGTSAMTAAMGEQTEAMMMGHMRHRMHAGGNTFVPHFLEPGEYQA